MNLVGTADDLIERHRVEFLEKRFAAVEKNTA